MVKGPHSYLGFFMLKWESTKTTVALFSFLKNKQDIFPLTNPKKLSVLIFPRNPRNLLPDSHTLPIYMFDFIPKDSIFSQSEILWAPVKQFSLKKPGSIWQSYNWTGIFDTYNYSTRNVNMNTTGLFDLVPGSEAVGTSSWEGIHSDRHEEFSEFSNFALQKRRFPAQFLARFHAQ